MCSLPESLLETDVPFVGLVSCVAAAECELFWEEGASGQVEVNKAWLAMLFGVLMSALHHMPLEESALLFPGGQSSTARSARPTFITSRADRTVSHGYSTRVHPGDPQQVL